MNTADTIYSVSGLTRAIKRLLEGSLPNLWVEGEVSNYKLHSSGHRYFTLKDNDAQLACVMWRTRRQPNFAFKDGIKVRIFGRIAVYEQGGRYQMDVESMLAAGEGDLQAAFEELKQRLNAEGLFDTSRKKKLPRFPRAIGIITSPTGAAVHDLIWGFVNRYPPAELFLFPVSVQGEGASKQIASAIHALNQSELVDVIVIGRGGGSIEDLWAFNEEVLIRAIVSSEIPIVSAVGHEVDITLSDLAADLRAPTPTAASGLIVPDKRDLLELLDRQSATFKRGLARNVEQWRERLNAIANGYGFKRLAARVGEERIKVDDLFRRTQAAFDAKIDKYRSNLRAIEKQIFALSPQSILERGFCVVRDSTGIIVRNSSNLTLGERVSMKFSTGSATSVIEETIPYD